MSYVDLKHRLAGLTMDVVADPDAARWVPVLAAYARAIPDAATGISWTELKTSADALAGGFGWNVSEDDANTLIAAGVLIRMGDRITLDPAFTPYFAYLTRHSGRLLSFLARYRAQTTPPWDSIPVEVWRGAQLFNAGLYFECHELLEGAWRRTAGPEKNFLHGLVQAAAAFYHYEKRNRHGVRTLLDKALRRLDPYPSHFLGVDLDDLRRSLAKWQKFLAADGAVPPPSTPVIQFAAAAAESTGDAAAQNKGTPRG